MGGRVLEFSADKYFNDGEKIGEARGEARGETKGWLKGQLSLLKDFVNQGIITQEMAAAMAEPVTNYDAQ